MSRQIKFRAWDAEQNKMIETFDGEYQIHVNEEDGTVYCGGHMPNGDWNEPPLMQFTGKYDKFRKEIFEGDIISTGTGKLMVVAWSEKFASWVIKREGWMFQHYFGEAFESEECEIVGNVYENYDVLSA